jgi:hypothetical protein
MLEFVLPGVSNQLHLLGRPGPSGESPTNQGATDIRRVYQQFRFRQAHPNYFPEYFPQLALWISPAPVEKSRICDSCLCVSRTDLAWPLDRFRLARLAEILLPSLDSATYPRVTF